MTTTLHVKCLNVHNFNAICYNIRAVDICVWNVSNFRQIIWCFFHRMRIPATKKNMSTNSLSVQNFAFSPIRMKTSIILLHSVANYNNNNSKKKYIEARIKVIFFPLFTLPLRLCYTVVLLIFLLLGAGAANQCARIHSHSTVFPHSIALMVLRVYWFNMILIVFVGHFSLSLHTNTFTRETIRSNQYNGYSYAITLFIRCWRPYTQTYTFAHCTWLNSILCLFVFLAAKQWIATKRFERLLWHSSIFPNKNEFHFHNLIFIQILP